MRSLLAFALAFMLAACDRTPTAPVTADASVGYVKAEPPAGENPELFCLEAIDGEKLDGMPLWDFLKAIANACRDAQPILGDGAREASPYLTKTSKVATILLRAAKKHPAFPKECDVADADAEAPVSRAFRDRTGCSDAAHRPYVSAGTYVFMVVLARVAWREPKVAPPWFQHWAYAEHYQSWKEGKVRTRLP